VGVWVGRDEGSVEERWQGRGGSDGWGVNDGQDRVGTVGCDTCKALQHHHLTLLSSSIVQYSTVQYSTAQCNAYLSPLIVQLAL
jgi:hypothetical protein